jgi:hypothetical protein
VPFWTFLCVADLLITKANEIRLNEPIQFPSLHEFTKLRKRILPP